MNLELLNDTKKNMQYILNHLNERGSFCDFVDDKDMVQAEIIDSIVSLCYDIHMRYKWLNENL